MATVDALGNLQPERGDILPREIARREDDPPAVTELIEKLNPTIKTAEDLGKAVEQVDALRRELASEANQDNPHIADPDEPVVANDEADSPATPAPSQLGRQSVKSPAEL